MHKSLSLVFIAVLVGCGNSSHKTIDIDNYTEKRINYIIETQVKTANSGNSGEVINKVSAEFLGTPYKANTLIGSSTEPEKLVIDFRGLDCFTYLDYVNSLRKSTDRASFVQQLVGTRYINKDISYKNRKHFFTDWSHRKPLNAQDVTAKISSHAVTVTKYLNQKGDGGEFIPTLGIMKRDVTYIPAEFIDNNVIHNLKTGDYIGIYTNIKGLDVTHTGIFIMTPNGPMLRNASSLKKNMKVVDSPFIDYVKNTPGIVVLRAL
ncbi:MULTISPECIES: DUF1460 domain-containing protein [Yersinia]|uniref:DUF1460 domain-containing protein n=1 Tax=Yersinia TaxID=629 RepID=UPI0005E58C22|nr:MULTISPECIES: DUF1460 domain-containing protein [Yersinia]OVZ97586.1 hypothetical protein CBW53_09315 [Yersinia frederiksenii]RXA94758.1 DUF1460 domain-containing protein [Yersinia sp. 2105 StPb PI]CNI04224.1 Lipoprotein [Yersinia frederiksenii]CNI85214.1 Lipoprotein [Yersinia frederiksenii]CNK95446.1 Lipoprotein [Yersinia frederiksenii]